jgi:YfiH family protein
MSHEGLRHPLLERCGVEYAFGERSSRPPEDALRPVQVHGCAVARVAEAGVLEPAEADAVVSTLSGRPVAVVTADCVPVLVASEDGRAVAAIHAGWKGLARGVIPAAIEALRPCAGRARLVAVVGPHIGPDHYEVDAPVIDALRPTFGAALDRALHPTRPGHARLDLGQLALAALRQSGIGRARSAAVPEVCTYRDAHRFHSYRRDGAAAGRLVHYIAPRPPEGQA